MDGMKKTAAGLAACLIHLSSALAGTIEQAVVVAEPQMQVKDGAIQGCGYRLMSAPLNAPNQQSSVLMDASFILYDSGVVLLKGGATQVNKTANGSKAINKPIDSFWIKPGGHKPTTPFERKIIPSETKGYVLFGIPLDGAVPLFEAITSEKRYTIGMRLKGEKVDRIYTGIAQISEENATSGAQCLSEMINAMQQDQRSNK